MREVTITDWSKLGATVKTQRQRLGLTQAATAERAEVSRSWLARVEAGHRAAELEQVLRLLRAVGLVIVLRASEADASPNGQAARDLRDRHRESAANRRRAWGVG
jgi:HTH-type transcriptional regulator/antitoxin HipB